VTDLIISQIALEVLQDTNPAMIVGQVAVEYLYASDPLPVSAPTLTATPASASEIDLSWTAVDGATGYSLERSANGTDGWQEIVDQAELTHTDSGLDAATTYYYRVRVYNDAGDGPYSEVASATTEPAAPATAPRRNSMWLGLGLRL
jgi:hypothetical protein